MTEFGNYINGEFVYSENGYHNINPATGETIPCSSQL